MCAYSTMYLIYIYIYSQPCRACKGDITWYNWEDIGLSHQVASGSSLSLWISCHKTLRTRWIPMAWRLSHIKDLPIRHPNMVIILDYINYWLVVGPPLWKIWTSIGMMKFPIYGKTKNVPKHQPEYVQMRKNNSFPRTTIYEWIHFITFPHLCKRLQGGG